MPDFEGFLANHRSIREDWRPHFVDVVARFCELRSEDAHFHAELTSGDDEKLWQRLWEAVLGMRLNDLGYSPSSTDEGPDFKIGLAGRTVWVEAICPGSKGLPADWVNPVNGQVTSLPTEALTLKWTAALKEKMEKLEGVDGKPGYHPDLVKPDEPYVIAVNSFHWGSAETGLSQFPFSAEVAFGIGPLAVQVSESGEFGDPYHSTRLSIVKAKTDATVDTAVFFSDHYAGVSAVLSCGSLCPNAVGAPFTLVHNPFARAPLDREEFQSDIEYYAVDEGDEVSVTRIR